MGTGGRQMNMLSLLWTLLGLFVVGLSVFSFRLFYFDMDKRKLMFALGLLFSSFSFFLLGFGYIRYGSNAFIADLIYHWGPTTYMILLFHVLLERLFKNKNALDWLFKSFIVFILLSLAILSTSIITPVYYGFSMGLGTLVVSVFSIILIIKYRDISSHLFILSIISIMPASYLVAQIDGTDPVISYFSIFAFFIGYTFIALVFMSSQQEENKPDGIGAYFSIEKKLEQATKELQETKQTFHELFNQMIDAVVIVDRKGKILEASQKIFDELGAVRTEVIGHNFLTMSYFDRKTKTQLIKNIALRFAGKNIPPYEITAYAKNGEPIPYELHAGKIQYNGKAADMAVFRNLSERKQVEHSLHEAEVKYKTIFEKTGTAIGTFGDDSVITLVNTEFEKLTGYMKNEVEQQMHWYDLIPDKERKIMFEYHKQRSENSGNPPSEYTTSILDKDGKVKHVQVNIGLIPDTSLRIVSLIDITPLKEIQGKLEQVNKDLELKVSERTEKIQQLLKQKDEFIQQLGHDLKNPLGPLISLLPVLEKHENNPRYQEIIKVLDRNVLYMKNLVVKTIKLAQLNSPNTKFNFKTVDLNNILETVISTNMLLFQGKSITVVNNVNSEIAVTCDPIQLEELFINLLNNAVKYSNTNSNIFIDSYLSSNEVIISVKDTGIGMTSGQIQHIFDEFYKADGARHDFDSSGLGMPIAKRIVEKHGGRIWAESEGMGKGSSVYFTLPLDYDNNVVTDGSVNHSTDDISVKIDRLLAK